MKKVMYDFSVEDLASSVDYDLEIDCYGIRDALDSNISQYYESVQKMLKSDTEEQTRYYKYDLHYRYNVRASPGYLMQILNDIYSFDKSFDVDKYYNVIQKIDSNKVIAGIDSILANINPKKYQNMQSLQNENTNKERLKTLHKEMLESWRISLENRVYNYKKAQVKALQDSMIERVKAWLEQIQNAQDSTQSKGELGKDLNDMLMSMLKENLASGKSPSDISKDIREEKIKRIKESIKETELQINSFKRNSTIKELLQMRVKILSDSIKSQDEPMLGYSKDGYSERNGPAYYIKLLDMLESDSIKRLCDILGRLNDVDEVEKNSSAAQRDFTISKFAKEEISGLTLGRDLENVLPSELALLNDSDFSILFDLKYAENRLFSLEKQGQESSENDKQDKKAKGPVIICMDTSGSMHRPFSSATAIDFAKALTFYIAKRAHTQERNCYVIMFSTKVRTLDLSDFKSKKGIAKLHEFLSFDLVGGTEPILAIKEALRMSLREDYKMADMLIISDFYYPLGYIYGNLREFKKDRDNKCHALVIGEHNLQKTESLCKSNKSQKKIFGSIFRFNEKTYAIDIAQRN